MEFPDTETIEAALDEKAFPTFASVTYEPQTPELDDVRETARTAVASLPLDELPDGATVAVGLGSRGIHDIQPVARTVIDELSSEGYKPVVVPAMGSHGGATSEGQRQMLEGLGLTEETLGCPIDACMDTVSLGTTETGNEVPFSSATLEADGIIVINRVKAHTNFTGRFESGLCKMITIGLGKQEGAQAAHEAALVDGYGETIERALTVIHENAPVLGGVAIVENFYDRTAHIEGVPIADLPEAEEPLLAKANEYMPTLPFDDLDILVVEQIGKDISGAGMDTNVIGRYQVLNTDDPETPAIKRIVVLGLTEATHGNGQGIGLADITTAETASALDLDQVYTNALTSSSLSKARLPVVLPSPEHAVLTAVATIGSYDPESVRIVWIQDTAHLSEFRVSEALFDESVNTLTVDRRETLSFDNGGPVFTQE
jgi:hypothetical protein